MIASQTLAPIPMHPEPVLTEPNVIRWVIPAGIVEPGLPVAFPEPLAQLFRQEVLRAAIVEDTAIWFWLGPEASWAEVGSRVRSALAQALSTPAQWQITPADDLILRHVALEVLHGSVGEVIGSHGGSAELISVDDNTVTVSLSGACSSCPAIEFTLRNRIDQEIRRRHCRLEKVVAASN